MAELKNIAGNKYGRLTAIKISHRKGYTTYWTCDCDCGNAIAVNIAKLNSGHTKSCGCLKEEKVKEQCKTHGMTKTKAYNTWGRIKARCCDKNHPKYDEYGNRGVKVCDEWVNDFEAFYQYVGDPDNDNQQLDRINNNGHYEPGNVRWTDRFKQAQNKRNSKWWYVDGVRYESCYEAGRILGVHHVTVFDWCKNGIRGCYSEFKYDNAEVLND